MEFTGQMNLKEFNDELAAFIRFHGVGLPKALRYQGRLLAQLLIKLTPPKTRAQGRAAVKRDIGRAVRSLKPADFKSKKIRALIRKRDYGGLEVVFSRFPEKGDLRNVSVLPFAPALHDKARDSRGRVTRFKRQATPDADLVTEYVSEIQTHVGRGKGGWAKSLIGLGGTPAAWIAAHADAGTFADKADDPVKGYILMTNESEWASRGDDDRVVSNALRSRTLAIRESLAKAQDEAMQRAFRN